jgi:F-type H+-transporting ATPase subunit b
MFSLTAQDAQMIPFGALFFVGLWLLLGRFVFKPFLALVEARERATSGAVDAAKEKIAQANELRQSYEQKIGAVRLEAVRQKLDVVAAAKKSAAHVAEEAERNAQEALKQGRANIARDVAEVRNRSLADADNLAEMIVQKVKSGSSASTGIH